MSLIPEVTRTSTGARVLFLTHGVNAIFTQRRTARAICCTFPASRYKPNDYNRDVLTDYPAAKKISKKVTERVGITRTI